MTFCELKNLLKVDQEEKEEDPWRESHSVYVCDVGACVRSVYVCAVSV